MSGDPKEPSSDWNWGGDDHAAGVPKTPPADPPAPDVRQSATAAPDVNESPDEQPRLREQSSTSASLAATPAAPAEAYKEEDHEAQDEPFDRDDAQKLGIVGGKGVGKSYLFQAMVFRTFSGSHSGAMTYYLERDGIHLFTAAGNVINPGTARSLNRFTFIDKFKHWHRLPQTTRLNNQWYRLRLLLRSGWLGRQQSAMDVEFFDGSGEGFFELPAVTLEDKRLWGKAYRKARTMVFCLPLWAVFPNNDLTDDDWKNREDLLTGYEQVVQNYRDMRIRHSSKEPVSSILALTMADDRRSALRTLHDRWISPYLESPHTYLKQLRRGSGVARYLSNARKISEALHDEFLSSRDTRVAAVPQSLNFEKGKPWIIPLSAIDGARLADLERRYENKPDDTARRREVRSIAPTPVHVELPLLVALCERENALM